MERIEYDNFHAQRIGDQVLRYQTLKTGDKVWLESLQHPEELGKLVELCKIAKVETVLEIGAGPCGTAVYFAEMVGPEGYVVSVDLPVDVGGTPEQYEKMAKAKAENWTMVRGASDQPETLEAVKKALGGREVGLLFIDGEHTRRAAENDYETYRKLMLPNGVIAFHDITLKELWTMWCGIRGKRHPASSFEFIDDRSRVGFGIGALVGRDENL